MMKKRLTQTKGAGKKTALPPYVRIKHKTLADGTVKSYWLVRKRVTVNGIQKYHERACVAGSMTDYKDVLREVDAEINGGPPAELENGNKTFGELADYFERVHLVPADFSNGQKTNRGRRKTYTPLLYLTGYGTPADPNWKRKPLKGPNLGWRNLIGDETRLSSISGRRLAELKEDLFSKYPVRIAKWFPKDGKKRGEKRIIERKRSFTDVNLRLQVLRKMFTVARVDLRFDNGDPWMKRNPFQESSDPLIEVKKNQQRNRIMTFEEEALLRSVSDGPREHLALIVTGLVDTCMRSTEFFQLSVGDWRAREIAVQQMTTKTLRARTVPASSRFIDLIARWIDDNELTNDDWLLTRRSVRKADTRKDKPGMTGHVASCRTAWKTAKRLAGIRDLRLKDLRRTGATRLLRAGMPLAEISQILGHTDIKMTMVYIGVDHTSMERAVGFLDKMHAQHANQLQVLA